MMGAKNARIEVKNQCRTKTTSSVFFVSVHVCEKKPAMLPVGPVETTPEAFECRQTVAIAPGVSSSYQRTRHGCMLFRPCCVAGRRREVSSTGQRGEMMRREEQTKSTLVAPHHPMSSRLGPAMPRPVDVFDTFGYRMARGASMMARGACELRAWGLPLSASRDATTSDFVEVGALDRPSISGGGLSLIQHQRFCSSILRRGRMY
jgi:hypothetical protein